MCNGEPDSGVGGDALPTAGPVEAPASGTVSAERLVSMPVMRDAMLAVVAAVSAMLAAHAFLDERGAVITAAVVYLVLMAVATWQAVRARRAHPTGFDELTFREQNRIAKAHTDPQQVADLPPRLRSVAVAGARQHLHSVRVAGPWAAALILVYGAFSAWRVIDNPSGASVTNLIMLLVMLAPAISSSTRYEGRARSSCASLTPRAGSVIHEHRRP
ncbi:hypothetical protein Ae706Ps2_3204 [Pseudonocardia sp. Ae706_Ps2]|uniref:hypothetical protein n=1 Tax=unclassified Pseudonocardia TaxID=2619320 RepID=UPI00094B353C|nr:MULTISPECIES: hypothetical protein [unclassified Pseudonocardia]OLL99048.1 hypothetical protein Ae331Ps2_2715c [Pseudonocardia sp. Ae331_Ps2]OLM11911.1 hypothetical protein Ae505Ps2_2037c [Pseudonocardia sp. Ae505_Ps2]OLM24771.1 hypothetical protein Ae706Ps2_3204 [Pseudonocardia sp. Ae706_Ps2]